MNKVPRDGPCNMARLMKILTTPSSQRCAFNPAALDISLHETLRRSSGHPPQTLMSLLAPFVQREHLSLLPYSFFTVEARRRRRDPRQICTVSALGTPSSRLAGRPLSTSKATILTPPYQDERIHSPLVSLQKLLEKTIHDDIQLLFLSPQSCSGTHFYSSLS